VDANKEALLKLEGCPLGLMLVPEKLKARPIVPVELQSTLPPTNPES